MRRYDEVIDVRRGIVSGREAPTQFLWRDRLWVVRDILAHWVETGAWWEQPGVSALFGDAQAGDEGQPGGVGLEGADLLDETEVWRVEAIRARASTGVFDVSFGWALGQWRLVRCID